MGWGVRASGAAEPRPFARLLLQLVVDTGARRGELAAPRLGDLQGWVLRIGRAISAVVVTSTKTGRARRLTIGTMAAEVWHCCPAITKAMSTVARGHARSVMMLDVGMTKAASLLRQARTAAGLSQVELARRAGVTQSVISVYEAGRRQPSVPTLAALIAATGYELDLSVGKPRRGVQQLTGPVGRRLRGRRSEVVELADRHGVRVLGVFGSVARGEDRPDSDIDLLVELPAGMGLFALARVQNELEQLVGAPVDLIPAAGLKAGMRPAVKADLVPL